MPKQFLRWYLIVCLQLVSVLIAGFFGFHTYVWDNDQTKLSFVIFIVWVIGTGFIGYWHSKTAEDELHDLCKIGWYLAETCLALGMLGTVSGFLLMLGTAFAGIDVANTATLQTALVEMASGMGTALYTTLIGLIASIYLKSQLVNLENYADGLARQI